MAEQELQVQDKKELASSSGELTLEGAYFSPAVDIFDTEKELVLLADMPGIDTESVDVDLREDTLTILSKKASPQTQGQSLLKEYKTGNYFRSFRLTHIVDRSKISASISDGVLKVVLPKVEQAVPRKIPITTA